MRVEQGTIYTRNDGSVIAIGPERRYFSDDVEGTIAFMRATQEAEVKITDAANLAFEREFRRAIKRDEKGATP